MDERWEAKTSCQFVEKDQKNNKEMYELYVKGRQVEHLYDDPALLQVCTNFPPQIQSSVGSSCGLKGNIFLGWGKCFGRFCSAFGLQDQDFPVRWVFKIWILSSQDACATIYKKSWNEENLLFLLWFGSFLILDARCLQVALGAHSQLCGEKQENKTREKRHGEKSVCFLAF